MILVIILCLPWFLYALHKFFTYAQQSCLISSSLFIKTYDRVHVDKLLHTMTGWVA